MQFTGGYRVCTGKQNVRLPNRWNSPSETWFDGCKNRPRIRYTNRSVANFLGVARSSRTWTNNGKPTWPTCPTRRIGTTITRSLLCVIDVFSKYAWVEPLKDKGGKEMVRGFTAVFKIARGRKPRRLQSDKGKEFLNREVQKLLKGKDIHFFTTNNTDTKASVVERFQRTLKARMWRYISPTRKLDVTWTSCRNWWVDTTVPVTVPSDVHPQTWTTRTRSTFGVTLTKNRVGASVRRLRQEIEWE